ncbi:DUF6126 family protein [Streptomyces sp. GC420]|uniref:DUF6126 family protein n=1 Tax=Streptomyces sp. GC420 TaxID=2697568 RepID=UPI001414D305|nr:hypothetical protein [Streptomyces sp. GC420]
MADGTESTGQQEGKRPDPAISRTGGESEKWLERGLALRVFVYVFATHLFAGFVYLLFYLGEHAQK